ncbi:MAG: hypothetical protein KAX78_00160 [Phycisphaerae bacterium]|nr:hypothetical protein [Phycisphaerae bacterium]
MHRVSTPPAAFCLTLLTAVCLLMQTNTAYAHKLGLFATAEGANIRGYAYFSGGARPRNVTIEICGPAGQKLAQVKTNEKGEFVFAAKHKCDHVLIVRTADGHQGRFIVKADELPDNLPVLPDTAEAPMTYPGGRQIAGAERKRTIIELPSGTDRHERATATEIRNAVAEAVSKQIRPLREQLDKAQAQVRLHDILGGIGYIVGIAGIAFYLLAVRKLRKDTRSSGPPTP